MVFSKVFERIANVDEISRHRGSVSRILIDEEGVCREIIYLWVGSIRPGAKFEKRFHKVSGYLISPYMIHRGLNSPTSGDYDELISKIKEWEEAGECRMVDFQTSFGKKFESMEAGVKAELQSLKSTIKLGNDKAFTPASLSFPRLIADFKPCNSAFTLASMLSDFFPKLVWKSTRRHSLASSHSLILEINSSQSSEVGVQTSINHIQRNEIARDFVKSLLKLSTGPNRTDPHVNNFSTNSLLID